VPPASLDPPITPFELIAGVFGCRYFSTSVTAVAEANTNSRSG
jgi:hypothetical protein